MNKQFKPTWAQTPRMPHRPWRSYLYIYIYIHTYMHTYTFLLDGRIWAHVFSKNGPVGGPHLFHTVKIGISEEKCSDNKIDQNFLAKSQVALLMGQKLCFVKTNPWIGQGLVERDPSLTVCCHYENSGFGRHIVQSFCASQNICPKHALCLHLAKFCVPSLWNACFCSLIVFRGTIFGPIFGPWAIWKQFGHFLASARLRLLLPNSLVKTSRISVFAKM